MLSEEALILYASFIGLGLLALGLWELLAPAGTPVALRPSAGDQDHRERSQPPPA
jgi:hypothetical protein